MRHLRECFGAGGLVGPAAAWIVTAAAAWIVTKGRHEPPSRTFVTMGGPGIFELPPPQCKPSHSSTDSERSAAYKAQPSLRLPCRLHFNWLCALSRSDRLRYPGMASLASRQPAV